MTQAFNCMFYLGNKVSRLSSEWRQTSASQWRYQQVVHLGGQSAPSHRSIAYILQVLFPLNEQVVEEEGSFLIRYFTSKTYELI
jgi:hypothetical protein